MQPLAASRRRLQAITKTTKRKLQMAMASKAAALSTFPQAPADFVAQLATCESQIAELTTELDAINEQLNESSFTDVRELNAQKRQASDDLQFLQERLPVLQREAANQVWESKRDELNAAWPSLVKRRTNIVERYNQAVNQLMSVYQELVQVSREQVATLSQHGDMDQIVPGRGTPVLTLEQQVRSSEPARPEVAKLATDPTNPAYRERPLP
jgi:chromosome segregation ATPase